MESLSIDLFFPYFSAYFSRERVIFFTEETMQNPEVIADLEEQFKNDNTVKLEKVDGIPYIQRGRQFFIIDYVEEIQAGTGKKIEVLKEIPVQPPLNLNSDAPAESFKRTK